MALGRLVAVLNAVLLPAQALVCGPALGAPPRPATSAPRAAVRGCAVEAEEVLVTSDGGVRKRVLRAAPAGALAPKWGAMVRVSYTATFDNGTVFERHGPDNPFEFQLNTGQVIDGLARGVAAMRVGERAALTCAPEWAHGSLGLPPHIPGDETLRYTLELEASYEGPQVENEDFDMHVYRNALEGKDSGMGFTPGYRWAEGGEEVTLWIPLPAGRGARDVKVVFSSRELQVTIGDEGAAAGGELKGRIVPTDSYWVLEDDYPQPGERAVQVVLAKANSFTRWDGVIIGEEMLAREEVLAADGAGFDPEVAERFKKAIFDNDGLS